MPSLFGQGFHEAGSECPDFDRGPFSGRAAARNGQRLVPIDVLQQEKAANHFLGFCKRAVDGARLGDTGGRLGARQAFHGLEFSLGGESFPELLHAFIQNAPLRFSAARTLANRFDDQEHEGHGEACEECYEGWKGRLRIIVRETLGVKPSRMEGYGQYHRGFALLWTAVIEVRGEESHNRVSIHPSSIHIAYCILAVTMALFDLIYVSRATESMSTDELAQLLEQSRVDNERVAITGMMVYHRMEFMQLIEGDRAAVETLFGRIANDRRHEQVFKLWDGPVGQRSFEDWSMAFVAPEDSELQNLPGYAPLMERGLRLSAQDTPGKHLLLRLRQDFIT